MKRTLSNRERVTRTGGSRRSHSLSRRRELNVWREDDVKSVKSSTSHSRERRHLLEDANSMELEDAKCNGPTNEDRPTRQSSRMLRKMSGRRREITQDDPSLEALRLQKEVLLLQKQILDKASGVPLSPPALFSPQLQLPVVTQAMPVSRVADGKATSLRPASAGKKWVMALVPELPQIEDKPRSGASTGTRNKSPARAFRV
jgi:hypothetical protein